MKTGANKTTITVTYYEPTNGMRSFSVHSEQELRKDIEWLDASGYMYRVSTRTAVAS